MKFTYERAGKVVVGMIMFCLSAFILVMMALSDGQYIQKAFGMSENSIFYSFFARIQNARTGQTEAVIYNRKTRKRKEEIKQDPCNVYFFTA